MIRMTDTLSEEQSPHQINRVGGGSSNPPIGGPPTLAEAESYCRQLARGHYENFIVASLLLPRRMRQPFFNVYAFCRHADDLADESGSPQLAMERLADWQVGLDRCFAGRAEHPIFVALADTIRTLNLIQPPFDDLLDAFRQDQVKTRYADFDELADYCRRSANPVGQIVLRMAAADSPENVALSDAVCTGLQLANHWQDIARDFSSGRVYLPQDSLDREGVSEEMLGGRAANAAVRSLVAKECARARRFLLNGLPLADRVPRWLAADVRLFVHGGLATLDAIAAADHDTLARRPQVSRWKQIGLTVQAVMGRL
jgi:squalene synthase HpnC